MTKNKTIYIALRMTELEKSQLDYIREPGETQSACIRRLVNEKWCDQHYAIDEENGFVFSDRENHKSVLLRVVLPEDLRVKLDEKRGNVPASAFVRDLILKAIND